MPFPKKKGKSRKKKSAKADEPKSVESEPNDAFDKTKRMNFKLYMKSIERANNCALRGRPSTRPIEYDKSLKNPKKSAEEEDPRPLTMWKNLEHFKDDWLEKASVKVKSDKKGEYINDDLKEINWGVRCFEAMTKLDSKKNDYNNN